MASDDNNNYLCTNHQYTTVVLSAYETTMAYFILQNNNNLSLAQMEQIKEELKKSDGRVEQEVAGKYFCEEYIGLSDL